LAARGLAPITLAGQTPDADVSSGREDVRQAGAALLRRTLDLTVALGADQLNGVPYGVFGHPAGPTERAAFERSAVEVGRIADESHNRGVRMTFEVLNRYETSVVNTAAQAMEYVAASGSEHLWIHLDTFHMAVEEADASAAIRTALPRLGYLELGQSGRGPLSSGAVDIAGIVRQALDDGYEGRWGVEAFSRSTLDMAAADMLSIWRHPFDDGAAFAADASNTIDTGWAANAAGRV
jgi:D-psicose/D-tagatose/L-ribulose 3-epimerase